MKDTDRYEMAMWRFGLIAPAINGTYSAPSKLAYYRDVVAGGLTLPDGSEASYAPRTLSYWEWRYRACGFDALIDKGRGDKGHSRRLTPEAIEAIQALKKKFPKINATMVYEHLIESATIKACEVSLSTVQRFIRNNQDLGRLPKEAKDRKAFEAERVCECWQADTLYGPHVTDGTKKRRAYLISAIDDKSRLIVSSRFFFADSALNFQKVLKDAVLRFGIPEKLYVDNGGPYTNLQLVGICGSLGVALVHTQPYDAEAKGKIERWHRTLRGRYLSVLPPEATSSLAALNSSLSKWVTAYNTTVHSSIVSAPMDAYRKEADRVRVAKSAEWVSECFMNRIVRNVKGDCTITIDCISYDVPMKFQNTKVEVRYLPDDMDGAYIAVDGKHYPICRTDKHANSKARRTTSPYSIDYSKGGGTDVSPTLPA